MAVRVAINGFGRIGRLAFRQMFDAEGYEVVAINDLTSPEMLAHLLKYDTAQGTYKYASTVEYGENSITVNGKTITIYAKADASELPWGELDVDVVLECTGFYCSKEKSQAHIDAGAKKVIISAPAGNDLKTIVYGVNDNTLTVEDQIISLINDSQIEPSRIILGVPFYTRLWNEAQDGTLTTNVYSMQNSQDFIDKYHLEKKMDEEAGQNYVELNDTYVTYKLWIEDADSMQKRADLINKYELAGVAAWQRGFETPDIWTVLNNALKTK